MGDLSKHFSRAEFECQCGCGNDTADYKLVEVLEELREYFGTPIRITSGNRCEVHNRDIGGSMNSLHIHGRAADIQVSGVDPRDVQEYLKSQYPNSLGIGSYITFTHVDSRGWRARWGE